MSYSTCTTCGGRYHWRWEEAFDKFGFGDGDGLVMTHKVVNVLRNAGFAAYAEPWGCHNVVITSLQRDCISCIPDSACLGYDDPRDYLPADIIELLDAAFSDDTEVQP